MGIVVVSTRSRVSSIPPPMILPHRTPDVAGTALKATKSIYRQSLFELLLLLLQMLLLLLLLAHLLSSRLGLASPGYAMGKRA